MSLRKNQWSLIFAPLLVAQAQDIDVPGRRSDALIASHLPDEAATRSHWLKPILGAKTLWF